LIRAIEDARSEVEIASDIANRAASQASASVEATDTLSEQAKSIESILGLIREIAGQTNLLALNATIEAARAGDAGRGFAVVAQEVKSLANQTAQATDEIAKKIAAIQNATKASLESNGSIRQTVEEVQHSAERIRRAMEDQAQTVTMITASVDETALAADLMSNTIGTIRSDTENVVSEILQLERGFNQVNEKMEQLQDNAKRFVGNLLR
jgi:methyl-accepting chemotaxis protein